MMKTAVLPLLTILTLAMVLPACSAQEPAEDRAAPPEKESPPAAPPETPAAQAKKGRDPQKVFTRLDKDGDGSISSEEFLANAGRRFQRLCPEGQQTLGFEQFAAASGKSPEQRQAAFSRLDRDGDGSVTTEEFLENAKIQFVRIDADGSGALDLGEYTSGPAKAKRNKS